MLGTSFHTLRQGCIPYRLLLYAECKAGVGRAGYLEEVAYLYPLIISVSGKSLGSLETLGLTWKQSNPGCETRK